jgi:glycosyltransferase involved in cell wall biosynthesis
MVVRAVHSVLAQTMRDFEIIVVIDGGDPATIAALETIADSRLRTIVRPVARGAGLARDAGADAAVGDWIAFLDDDDEWMPQKLERQLAVAPADRRAVLATLYRVVSAHGETISPLLPYDGRRPIDEWLFGRQTWLKAHEAMLQTSAIMVPRDMFRSLHFRDAMHEEWEICIRAVKELGYAFITVEEPLVTYYAPLPNASALSMTHRMERSMAWADSVGPLLSRRAYSGFALTVATQVPPSGPRWRAMVSAFKAAVLKGSPTPRQLFAFAGIALVPHSLRRRIRALRPRRPQQPA